MKKIYSFFTSARSIMTTLVLMFAASQAFAGETSNYWHYDVVSAYPTGGGKVYISPTYVEDESKRKYESEIENKYLDEGAYSSEKIFYLYAKPEEGYAFAGWKAVKAEYWDDIIDDPTIKMVDYMENDYLSYDAETYLYFNTTASSEAVDVDSYNIVPDNTVVAIFGRIGVTYIPGQEKLGSFVNEDPSADFGDFTTLTATPADSLTKFEYWLDDEGNKYTQNPLEVTVTRTATYYPVFSNPNYVTIDFGAEGSYKILGSKTQGFYYANSQGTSIYPLIENTYISGYDTTYVMKPTEVDTTLIIDGVEVDTFLVVDKETEVLTPIETAYTVYESNLVGLNYVTDANTYSYHNRAGEGSLVYGKGLISFQFEDDEPSSYETYLVPADAEGTDIAKLPTDMNYYLFDNATKTFVQVTEGVVPAYYGYLALPKNVPASHFSTLKFVNKNEVADLKVVNTTFNRLVNGGYTADAIEYDQDSICALLGVETLAGVKVNQVNVSTLENTKDYNNDGWLTKEGDYTTWGNGSYVCLKTPTNGKMAFCTMPGNEPALGSSWLGLWSFSTDSATVYLQTLVNFIKEGGIDYDVVKTITVNKVCKPNTSYEGATAEFDPAEVCEALGIAKITDAKQYIMNVTDGSLVTNTTDGWRGANGDALPWGNAGGVCVKIQDPASGSIDYIGTFDTAYGEGDTYTAKWAFLSGAKCVVIDVVLKFTNDATAIENINGDVKNATIYNLNGQKLAAPVKGINIINGKKFMVK